MPQVQLNRKKLPTAYLPTRYGDFQIVGFQNEVDGEQAVAMTMGLPHGTRVPLVRIHSQCLTGDVFHSLRCDCGDQLEVALSRISESGCGILLYQLQEGRGIGLMNKLFAYHLQDEGMDTVEANLELGFEPDERTYQFCAEILKHFGVTRVRLMSNNPGKLHSLERGGLLVEERVPLVVQASPISEKYLRTKKEKLGHLL